MLRYCRSFLVMMGRWQAAKSWKLSQVTSSGHGGRRTTQGAWLITIKIFCREGLFWTGIAQRNSE